MEVWWCGGGEEGVMVCIQEKRERKLVHHIAQVFLGVPALAAVLRCLIMLVRSRCISQTGVSSIDYRTGIEG